MIPSPNASQDPNREGGRRSPAPGGGITGLAEHATGEPGAGFPGATLTPELVAAIRLISPHCHLSTNDSDREVWERDQNGACWGEYEALLPLFRAMPPPHKVLEIGCGLGRSLVFFNKKLTRGGGEFQAYDADGRTTHYAMLGQRNVDSFCGNLPMLRYVLDYNNVGNVRTFDAMEVPLAALPGPYDLIYSFYSVGFHWALQHFLPDLLPLMHDRTIAVFTIPLEFVPFPELDRFFYRIVGFETVVPCNGRLQLLVVSKTPLPECREPGSSN